jgi:DnaJ-class molecular chaperone
VIISLKTAEEAAAALGLTIHPALDENVVNMAYRVLAKVTHPDAGGSLEAFAEVDRAKHILLMWLKADAAKPVAQPHGEQCPRCAGKGFVASQRGFRAMRVSCPMCRGTGELGVEQEKEY